VDAREECVEAGASASILWRKVGTREEGLSLRGEKDGHGPTAGSVERDGGRHVDLIEIGALFSVDFDRNEVLIEQLSDACVFEGLALHDVTPMARRVADTQKDGLVFSLSLGESLFAPGKPIHRIPGVLEEVGTGLGTQPTCAPLHQPELAQTKTEVAPNRAGSRNRRVVMGEDLP